MSRLNSLTLTKRGQRARKGGKMKRPTRASIDRAESAVERYARSCKRGVIRQPASCGVSAIYNVSTRRHMLKDVPDLDKLRGRSYMTKTALAAVMRMIDVAKKGGRAPRSLSPRAKNVKRLLDTGFGRARLSPKRGKMRLPKGKGVRSGFGPFLGLGERLPVRRGGKKKAASAAKGAARPLPSYTKKQLMRGVRAAKILSQKPITAKELQAKNKEALIRWIRSNILLTPGAGSRFLQAMKKMRQK